MTTEPATPPFPTDGTDVGPGATSERARPLDQVAVRARAEGFVRERLRVRAGRRVVEVDARGRARAGALSPADGATIADGARRARDERVPFVIWLASSGADATQGAGALHGWAGAAREMSRNSGIVPQVAVVTGPAVSGPALMLGLADVVILTGEAYAFVSGPVMVRRFTGVPVDQATLGGADVHTRTSGVATFVAADAADAAELVDAVLAFLPDHTDTDPPALVCDDPVDRRVPEAYEVLPDSPTGAYDVRQILAAVVDHGDLLEHHPEWATNLVTAFARIGGRPVGLVANQPLSLAGTLDITASRKGARFVAFCDAFNLPLVTFVDTSGFYPGKDLEWRGMIRYGAQMAFAYARATVPRVNVTLRKSYGGAYIVMDSKRMGNDVALAWPSAEIAVMGAKGAVEILHRRADPAERLELERRYEERLLNPYIAAERGTVDAVIDPADTRREIHEALEMLLAKREKLPRRRHDNTPL